jgi:hypothetical protein
MPMETSVADPDPAGSRPLRPVPDPDASKRIQFTGYKNQHVSNPFGVNKYYD